MPATSQVQIEARWFGVEYANERQYLRSGDETPLADARFEAMGFPSGSSGLPARDPDASHWHGTQPYADLREARGVSPNAGSEIDQGPFNLTKLHRSIFRPVIRRISALLSDLPQAPSEQRSREFPGLPSDAVLSGPSGDQAFAYDAGAYDAHDENAANSLRFAALRDTLRAVSLPPAASGDARSEITGIAEQFRSLRKSLGLSRLDAAQHLGCTLETVVVLENGYASADTTSTMLQCLSEQSTRP